MNSFKDLDWKTIFLPDELRKKNRLVGRDEDKNSHQDLLDLISNRTEYAGFGSFRSKNVQDLITQKDEDYRPPFIPIVARRILSKSDLDQIICWNDDGCNTVLNSDVKECSSKADDPKFSRPFSSKRSSVLSALVKKPVSPCSFGDSFRKEHFLISPEVIFVNHGAFGGALSGALEMKHQLEKRMENEIVDFVDREHLPLLVYSTRKLCEHFHASFHQLALLQNATFGMNSALRIIEKGDVVAYFDTEYLAVYKALWYRCQEVGVPIHEISLNKYLHDECVMGDDEALSACIAGNLPLGCTTVVLDHITSTSALCFPIFTHLIPALRRKGVNKIIVDGAHAPLQVELNFDSLLEVSQPTIYMGNLHKWFCSPKSVGFMWVRQDYVSRVSSAIRSHGAGEGFLSEFIWDGTKDYGAYFTIPPLIDFWRIQGIDRIRHYCSGLLESAVGMLTEAFHSRRVARHSPFMSLVELPEVLQPPKPQGDQEGQQKTKSMSAIQIQDILRDFFSIEVPVKEIEGRFYLRISVFVYNRPAEYVCLKEAINLIVSVFDHSR